MKLFSALFDTMLLPVAVAKDVFNPWPQLLNGSDSFTRKQIEKIEDDLG